MQIKHVGRGMFSAIDDQGNRVGPVGTKEEVAAWVAAPAPSEAVKAVAEVAATAAKPLDPVAYRERLKAARANIDNGASDEVRAVLTKHFDGYILERVMRRIGPILKNPKRRHKAI